MLVVVSWAAAGCGSAAVISRADGASVHGEIVGSSRGAIYVGTAGGASVAIPRDEVVDIDHPGNVAAAIGGGVAGYGVLNIAVAAKHCDREGTAFCIGVFTPAVVGASLLTYGLAIWAGSVSAAEDGNLPSRPGRTLSLAPLWVDSPELEARGMSVIGSF